ncbi:MAG TPA: hypothetical protein VFC92_08535 [Bacteroidales bacterium]|nr:hypothetical protein [Bacteroidales bacterium]
MKQLLLILLTLVSVNLISQNATQIYNFGGKDLKVNSKYDCSEKHILEASDFSIVNVKIPKWIFKMSDPDELNEVFDESITEKFTVLKKRKVEFKSFGNKFSGFLYKIEKDGKIKYLITSFGIIEDAINLSLKISDKDFDFDKCNLPSELVNLIKITELH